MALLGATLLVAAGLACAPSGTAPETDEQVTAGRLVERAESARAAGELDGAIEAYREALDRTPWNTRLQRVLAETYADRAARARDEGPAGLGGAEQDLREAQRLAPDDANVRHNLAVVLLERADRAMDASEARELRAEALALDPSVAEAGPARRADIERRLDLAYDLVREGHLDAGIERLERIRADHESHSGAIHLLARALATKGLRLAERGRHAEAAGLFDRAVALYARLPDATPPVPFEGEVRLEVEGAHRNRVVSWLNASRPDEARSALAESEAAGFRLPDLSRAIAGAGP